MSTKWTCSRRHKRLRKKLPKFQTSQTASGVRQKDIAEKVGLSKQAVSKIVSPESTKWTEKQINAVSPSAEIESLRRKLEEAEAARRSTEQRLSAVQSDLKTAKMVIETAPKNAERDKEFLRNKLKEEQERHDAERGGRAAEGHCGEGRADATVGITHCQGQYK